ncbi:hypothetical protein Tco_0665130 [Tanacetum coccineum]
MVNHCESITTHVLQEENELAPNQMYCTNISQCPVLTSLLHNAKVLTLVNQSQELKTVSLSQALMTILKQHQHECKQGGSWDQLNAKQADWKDDTDDDSEELELEAHYYVHWHNFKRLLQIQLTHLTQSL